jgi:DNA-binding protein H-NS
MKALKSMTNTELADLRSKIDATIRRRDEKERRELTKMVQAMQSLATPRRSKSGMRGEGLRGRKLKPKYHNPADRTQTWAGRGLQPRWLKAELKRGKKLSAFLIG